MPVIPEGSNIFVVDLEYLAPLEQIEPLINEHIKFLEKYYALNVFIASGAKVPRVGGVILAVSQSKETIIEIIKEDPFHINNLAKYTTTEFRPTMANEQLR